MALRVLSLPAAVVCLVLAGCAGNGAMQQANSTEQSSNPSTPAISLSGTSFDFGENAVGNSLTQSVVAITNTGGTAVTLNPSLSGDASFALDPADSCKGQINAGTTCPIAVTYLPQTPSVPGQQKATLNLNFTNAPAGTPGSVTLTGTSGAITAGAVTASNNPQVALYTVNLPFNGKVAVNFGTDTTYGRSTSFVSAPNGGGPVTVEVAGMLAQTAYHMRATVQLPNGVQVADGDHVFTTGAVPAGLNATFTATTTPGLTPQPGIELISVVDEGGTGALATDLAGNVIWTYPAGNSPAGSIVLPIRRLANGHMVVLFADGKQIVTGVATPTPSPDSILREIDLAGNTIRQVSVAQVDAQLQQGGYDFVISNFSHDVLELPNGHWVTIGQAVKNYNNLPGYPGTLTVTGDTIVDLDENLNVAWAWNSFDHLDINHHPMSFPDWTHANSLLYSIDDGNLLISLRHQNWVLKINYQDGKGDGRVLWHLGQGGDFKLIGGVDPTDWFYAQHGMDYFSGNTTGVFTLGLMDNGDDRMFPPGVACGSAGAPACLYSSIPVLQVDENAMTATLIFHDNLPPALYNSFGGNTQALGNTNINFDLCGLIGSPTSEVYEVTSGPHPQTVWQLNENTPLKYLYRAVRIPSLYQNVEWQ
jgi:arylsulfate sulfotransferase